MFWKSDMMTWVCILMLWITGVHKVSVCFIKRSVSLVLCLSASLFHIIFVNNSPEIINVCIAALWWLSSYWCSLDYIIAILEWYYSSKSAVRPVRQWLTNIYLNRADTYVNLISISLCKYFLILYLHKIKACGRERTNLIAQTAGRLHSLFFSPYYS